MKKTYCEMPESMRGSYPDGGRVCGGEQAEEYQRDDYPGDSAEFPGGLVSAPVGEVAEEQPGSVPYRAGDADDPGQRRGLQYRVHRRDAAKSPGPGSSTGPGRT